MTTMSAGAVILLVAAACAGTGMATVTPNHVDDPVGPMASFSGVSPSDCIENETVLEILPQGFADKSRKKSYSRNILLTASLCKFDISLSA